MNVQNPALGLVELHEPTSEACQGPYGWTYFCHWCISYTSQLEISHSFAEGALNPITYVIESLNIPYTLLVDISGTKMLSQKLLLCL